MKMQEVITKLREEAPLLEKCSKDVDAAFQKVRGLFVDFRRAESVEGQGILADAVVAAFIEFEGEYRTLRGSVETVCLVNAEYKEKLGPRTKKSEDAEGQQMLPGLEADGGTSTMQGDMPSMQGDMPTMQGDMPTMQGDMPTTQANTPSFILSGRHG